MRSAILATARRLSARLGRSLGQLASMILLAGCATAAAPSFVAARRDFSRERYCPLRRVSAATVDVTPRAPPAIARDPERLAMWRSAAKRRAGGTRVVAVAGCDERAVYVCHEEIISQGFRRRSRSISLDAVCLDQAGTTPEVR